MPTYITIDTTAATIDVLFNDITPLPNEAMGADFKRSELIELWRELEPIPHIKLIMDTGFEWRLALVGDGDILPVTSVAIDGGTPVIPSTIDELHTELKKLFI